MLSRAVLVLTLILPTLASSEPLDLSATWTNTEPGASATYDIFLNQNAEGVDFQIDIERGRCLYLVAYNPQGQELWVQRPEILTVPVEVQLTFSIASRFPFQLFAMHGTREICSDISRMLDNGRYYSLNRGVISQLRDITVSSTCVIRGIESNQNRRMGQGEPGCP